MDVMLPPIQATPDQIAKRVLFNDNFQKPQLDQFYTKPKVANACIRTALKCFPEPNTLFVEPSAGYGAFFYPLQKKGLQVRGIDIDPKSPDIKKGDFFNSPNLFEGNHKSIVVIGNPPFGKNSSNAVRFFNHAANYADGIAFIIPRTFRKLSLQRRLNEYFHLEIDRDIKPHSFIRNGNSYDVPCAWQIWLGKSIKRPFPKEPQIEHLLNYTTPEQASFAMRRVGYYAGRIIQNRITELSRSTHYFIEELKPGIVEILKAVDWTKITKQTAGVRSLSKYEIALKLEEHYNAC